MNFIIIASLISFFGTLLVMPSVIKLAINKRFLVGGGGRNAHEGFTPNVGGMAIFAGLLLANQYILFYFFDSYQNFEISNEFEIQIKGYLIMTAGSIIMFVMGLLDDISELSSYFRFFVQLLVSSLVVYFGDLRILDFHGVLGVHELPYLFSVIFSISVIIFIINSFNLTDGLDGLAASLGLFILMLFAIIFYCNGKYYDCTLACAGFSSLLAFWLYNKPPARIFMGDGGSLMIGFIIACCAIRACSIKIEPSGVINPVFILCILAYPSVDTLRVFLVRIFSGKSPFSADRNHIHHLLVDKDFNHGWASFFAVMYSAVLTGICYLIIEHVTLSFYVMVSLAVLFIVLPMASFARSTTKQIFLFFK
jgi:UDP-N-acetylmuramyl pentapeptide phosphotransferase/UDP-N-acetylglucosamine-1-phosphate transferase